MPQTASTLPPHRGKTPQLHLRCFKTLATRQRTSPASDLEGGHGSRFEFCSRQGGQRHTKSCGNLWIIAEILTSRVNDKFFYEHNTQERIYLLRRTRSLPSRRNQESCRSLIVGGTTSTRCNNLYMSINAIKCLKTKKKFDWNVASADN